MPGARCTRSPCAKKCAHGSHHGRTGITRHSRTRMVLTAYAALFPATNSSCHRHRRISGFARPGWADENLRRFDTSNGCQDHTVLPSASRPRQVLRRIVHPHRSFREAGKQRRSSARIGRSRNIRPAITHAPDTAASTASHPNVCDDGQRPSLRDETAAFIALIWGWRERECFCSDD